MTWALRQGVASPEEFTLLGSYYKHGALAQKQDAIVNDTYPYVTICVCLRRGSFLIVNNSAAALQGPNLIFVCVCVSNSILSCCSAED